MFYGRKGLLVAVISVIDLAIWDLLGKIRNEPVYKLIGGATRERLHFTVPGQSHWQQRVWALLARRSLYHMDQMKASRV
jgi:L-alanine-DL-glutamate epimerase-like enolase superfamily enzyme